MHLNSSITTLIHCKCLIPIYIQDSFEFKSALNKHDNLSHDTFMFKADAISMYTNIDTMHRLHIIENLLNLFEFKKLLSNDFPKEFLLNLLLLIMTHNTFKFGPSYWLQISGTAIGTHVACSYTTLYYGWFEIMVLLCEFKITLIELKRLIDDLFGLWKGSKRDFNRFKKTVNIFGILKWEFTDLTKKLDYLDLNLTIKNGKITTKKFEKKHNLYLYIPFTSWHSANCKKSLIYSLCFRYFHLNDSDEDYITQVYKLYERLLKRGYPPSNTKNIIIEATTLLQQTRKGYFPSKSVPKSTPISPLKNTLIFKTTYHKTLNKKALRYLIKKNLHHPNPLESNFNFNRNIIAYKRQNNLQELLFPSKLKVPTKLLHLFYPNST